MARPRRKPNVAKHVKPEDETKRKIKAKLRPLERAVEEAKAAKKH